MPLTHKYLDWNKALIPQVRDALLNEIDSTVKPIDLSAYVIIVPTNQSGRHLLEALADNALTYAKGLLSPKILTPVQFLEAGTHSTNKANEIQCVSAWIEVLKDSSHSDLDKIFPQAVSINESFIRSNAQRFFQLKQTIGAEGYDIQSIARKCQKFEIEVERWQQLASVELRYESILKKHKLIDPTSLKQITVNNYPLDPSITKLLLIATPDPQPLALTAFKNLNSKVDIEVWVHGPNDDLFDEWGIPITEKWLNRKLEYDEWNLEINKIKQPLDLPSIIEDSIKMSPVESLQVGLLDRTLIDLLENYFKIEAIKFNNPEGRPLSDTALGNFVRSLIALEGELTIEHLRQLLLNPYFFKHEVKEASLEELLKAIDDTFTESLSYDLGVLKTLIENSEGSSVLIAIINKIQNLAESFNSNEFVSTLKKYIASVVNETGVIGSDLNYIDLTNNLNSLMEEYNETIKQFDKVSLESQKALLLETINKTQVYEERHEDSHDLLGWLELLWHDAPHSLLCGFNEGTVPNKIKMDSLLPETLRRLLNLSTNESSYAKDIYLFESICRKRSYDIDGKVSIIFCENDLESNPLYPSRILFNLKREALLKQTKQILIDEVATETFKRLEVPWKLKEGSKEKLPSHFSVSALKDYLQCPFRFYLKHILKLPPKKTLERELSPAIFGTLFHDTVALLQGYDLDYKTDAIALKDALIKKAESLIFSRFGNRLSFALEMQKETLLGRIQAFVEAQIKELEIHKSLRIISTEQDFKLDFEPFDIHGKIDRIDSLSGAKRLIDYKTSENPIKPKQAHLKGAGTKGEPSHLPSEAYFEINGKIWYWQDLQLPLYCLSEQRKEPHKILELAYFQIPKSEENTGIDTWDDFSEQHLESAEFCAKSILNCIQLGQFWPPNDQIDPIFDAYSDYFPDGITNTVDSEAFKNYTFSS